MNDFQKRFSSLKAVIFDWDSCLTHVYPKEYWDKFHYLFALYGVNNKGMTWDEAINYVKSFAGVDKYQFSLHYFDDPHDPRYRDYHIRTHQGMDVSHFKETACPLVTQMLNKLEGEKTYKSILSNGPTNYVNRGVDASKWRDFFQTELVFGLDRVGMPFTKYTQEGYYQVLDWISYIYGEEVLPQDVAMVEDSRANLVAFQEMGGMIIAIDNRDYIEAHKEEFREIYTFPTIQSFAKSVLSI